MPRPSTSKEVVQQIETIWAEMEKPPAQKVYNWAKRKVVGCPSLRKVQQIIREAKRLAGPLPTDPLLVPWGTDWPQDPLVAASLWKVIAATRLTIGKRQITAREARWVGLLSALFDYSGLEFDGLLSKQKRKRCNHPLSDWHI